MPLDKLLQAVSLGNVEDDVLSSVAARLARLDKDLSPADHAKVLEISGGLSLKDLASGIVQALNADPDDPSVVIPAQDPTVIPTQDLTVIPAKDLTVIPAKAGIHSAVLPFANPELRNLILQLRQKADLVVDVVTQDTLLHAGFSEGISERAKGLVQSFEQFIAQHKDEITALQILYNRPSRAPLTYRDIKALADALHAPPHLIDESQLWQAYAALNKTKVKGTSQRRLLTDLVSLVRFAMQQDNELVPYPERVRANYDAWLAQSRHSRESGNPSLPPFTPEQLHWLEMIRDHIAANLGIEPDDFEYAPFNSEGGLGKVHQLFGAELSQVIEAMNRELVA